MSLDLPILPPPNARTVVANYSCDRLKFITPCAHEFEDMVPYMRAISRIDFVSIYGLLNDLFW